MLFPWLLVPYTLVLVIHQSLVLGVLDEDCSVNSDCSDVANSDCGPRGKCRCAHFYKQDGTGCIVACAADELYCNNGKCVSLSVTNNTYNDCGDNSDEGVYAICWERAVVDKGTGENVWVQRFKCTNGQCVYLPFANDGGADCTDESDEYKHIGTPCLYMYPGIDRYTCDDFMEYSECVANADTGTRTPNRGNCACRTGAYANDDLLGCTLRILGDDCMVEPHCEDAIPHSECDATNLICVCDVGFIAYGDTVCRPRLIYESCMVDPDCNTLIANSHCDSGVCFCDLGYKVGTAHDTCTLRKIGDGCVNSPDCSIAVSNSECLDTNVCQCIYNFTAKDEGTVCVYRKLNDPCIANDHCIFGVANSVCGADGKCECELGFYGDQVTLNGCTLRKLSSPCDKNDDCSSIISNGVCSEGFCECGQGYYPIGDRICKARKLGDDCNVNEDCAAIPDLAHCINRKCACAYGWRLVGGVCQRRNIGDECSLTKDCDDAVPNSDCINGVCGCNHGYESSESGDRCNIVRIDIIPCANDTMCTNTNSICGGNGYCTCAVGYRLASNGIACVSISLDDPCETNRDCSLINPGGACIDDTCQCSSGYVTNTVDDGCDKLRVDNTTCTANKTCLSAASNTECADGVCKCVDGYQANIGGTKCDPGTIGNLDCNKNDYCNAFFNNSECFNNTCHCAKDYHATLDGRDCDRVMIGSLCSTNEVCNSAVPSSSCLDGLCKCVEGYEPIVTETDTQCTENCSFTCRYPWAVALLVVLVIGGMIAAAVVLYLKRETLFKRGMRSSLVRDVAARSNGPPPSVHTIDTFNERHRPYVYKEHSFVHPI